MKYNSKYHKDEVTLEPLFFIKWQNLWVINILWDIQNKGSQFLFSIKNIFLYHLSIEYYLFFL